MKKRYNQTISASLTQGEMAIAAVDKEFLPLYGEIVTSPMRVSDSPAKDSCLRTERI
jgi:hypothetical protein